MIKKRVSAILRYFFLSFSRFPFAFLSALFASIFFILTIESQEDVQKNWLTAGLVTSAGFPIWILIEIICDKWKAAKWIYYAISVLVGVGLLFYYLIMINNLAPHGPDVCHMTFLAGISLLASALISLFHFTRIKDNQLFLSYNRKLFTKMAEALLYGFFLFVTLSMALISMDYLLNVTIEGEWYGYLSVFSFIFFAPLYFLSGFPESGTYTPPSSILKVFVWYVFSPVVVIYGIILFLYGLKNVFSAELSTEGHFWWIIWFYLAGYLCFLLNLSWAKDEDNRWSAMFTKAYIVIMIPLSILVMISLRKLILEYGVNELSYIVGSFSIYLLLISLYFLYKKEKDYRVISGLFSIITLLSFFGPQSMCPICKKSQFTHLERKLQDAGALVDGKLLPNKIEDFQLSNEITRKLIFLENRNALSLINKWDLSALSDLDSPIKSEKVIRQLTAHDQGYYQVSRSIYKISYPAILLDDYAQLITVTMPSYDAQSENVLHFHKEQQRFVWKQPGNKMVNFDANMEWIPDTLETLGYFHLTSGMYSLDVYIKNAEFNEVNGRYQLTHIEGIALVNK